jgi:hypothetical protein
MPLIAIKIPLIAIQPPLGQATSTYRPCPACRAQKPADEPQYAATSAKRSFAPTLLICKIATKQVSARHHAAKRPDIRPDSQFGLRSKALYCDIEHFIANKGQTQTFKK